VRPQSTIEAQFFARACSAVRTSSLVAVVH
jgi:hypothetical protein